MSRDPLLRFIYDQRYSRVLQIRGCETSRMRCVKCRFYVQVQVCGIQSKTQNGVTANERKNIKELRKHESLEWENIVEGFMEYSQKREREEEQKEVSTGT